MKPCPLNLTVGDYAFLETYVDIGADEVQQLVTEDSTRVSLILGCGTAVGGFVCVSINPQVELNEGWTLERGIFQVMNYRDWGPLVGLAWYGHCDIGVTARVTVWTTSYRPK